MDLTVIPGQPLRIGASGMDALLQNIRIIVLTTMYSVPLDRGFAHVGDFIDSPSPLVTARLVARLTDAIEDKEPRVTVQRIELEASVAGDGGEPRSGSEAGTAFPASDSLSRTGSAGGRHVENAMQGRLYPHIRFELKEGVTL